MAPRLLQVLLVVVLLGPGEVVFWEGASSGVNAASQQEIVFGFAQDTDIVNYIIANRLFDNDQYKFLAVRIDDPLEIIKNFESGTISFALGVQSTIAVTLLAFANVNNKNNVKVTYALRKREVENNFYVQVGLNITDPSGMAGYSRKFKIGTVYASSSHFYASEMFDLFRIPTDLREYVFLSSQDEFIKAWDEGKIDGAFIKYEKAARHIAANGGKAIISSNDLGKWSYEEATSMIVHDSVIQEHPAAVQRVVDVLVALWKNVWNDRRSRIAKTWELWGEHFNASLVTRFGNDNPELKLLGLHNGKVPRSFEIGELDWVKFDEQASFMNEQLLISFQTLVGMIYRLNEISFLPQLSAGNVFNTSFVEAAIAKSKLDFKDMVNQAYTLTYDSTEESCNNVTQLTVDKTEQILKVRGNNPNPRICRFTLNAPSASSVIKMTVDYVWLEDQMVIFEASTGRELFRFQEYTRKDMEVMYFKGSVIVQVHLKSNSKHTNVFGYCPFGIAANQGLILRYSLLSTALCVTDMDCNGPTNGVCMDGICVCHSAYSGTFCATPHCGGFKHMKGTKGKIKTNSANTKTQPRMDCLWDVNVPTNSTVKIQFKSFNIFDGFDEAYLNVKGNDNKRLRVASFDSSFLNASSSPIYLKSSNFSVSYDTDIASGFDGFELEYEVVATNSTCESLCEGGHCREGECICDEGYYGDYCWSNQCLDGSGKYFLPKGSFVSQATQFYNSMNTYCVWETTPPREYSLSVGGRALVSSGIRIEYQTFDMEPDSETIHLLAYGADGTLIQHVLHSDTPKQCLSDLGCGLLGECNDQNECECHRDYVGKTCNIPRVNYFYNASTVAVIFVKDRTVPKPMYEGIKVRHSGIYPCASGINGTCNGQGDCVAGLCECFSGFYGDVCEPIPSVCDMSKDTEYSMYHQSAYSWENYRDGMTIVSIFLVLNGIALTATVVIYIVGTGFLQAEPKMKNQDSVKFTWSNISAVVGVWAEFVFMLGVSLSTHVSWSSDKGVIEQILDSFVLQGGDLFFVTYFWLFIIFLWCVYCLIFLLKYDDMVSQWWLGEMFLSPGLMYLQLVSTVGILPSVGALMYNFQCAFIPFINVAVIQPFCTRTCFTMLHKTVLVLSGILLLCFIPLTILTCHFWKELNYNLTITMRRKYVFFSQVFFYVVIIAKGAFRIYPFIFLPFFMTAILVRAAYNHLYLGEVVNVPCINFWIKVQSPIAFLVALVVLITHALDVTSPVIPLSAVSFMFLGSVITVILYTRKKYPHWLLNPKKRETKHKKSMLDTLLNQMQHTRKTSEVDGVINAKKALHAAKASNWSEFHNYCLSHSVSKKDEHILQNMLKLAIFWDECSSMDDSKRMHLFLDSAAEAYKQAGIRFRSRSLRDVDFRLHAKLLELSGSSITEIGSIKGISASLCNSENSSRRCSLGTVASVPSEILGQEEAEEVKVTYVEEFHNESDRNESSIQTAKRE
eukprot:Nk52_evm25s158 gene=Nk52_evmTU25s158